MIEPRYSNPFYFNTSTNEYSGVDTIYTLSGADTVVYDIMLSGNKIFFAGRFNYDINNQFGSFTYIQPPYHLRSINIGYFNTTYGRISFLKNIGTANFGIFDNNYSNAVYGMSLCGQNLVAVGGFSMINTEITGFSAHKTIPRTDFYNLSDTPPFNTNLNAGTVLTPNDFYVLFTSFFTNTLPNSCFVATLSGDPAVNAAYFNPALDKWVAFNNTFNFNEYDPLFTTEVVGNTAFAAGTPLSGTIFYYNDDQWKILSNSNALTATNLPPIIPSGARRSANMYKLYNDYTGNLICAGSFSAFDVDSNKTGILRYNFNNNTFHAMGSGLGRNFTASDGLPVVNSVVLSGSTYIASGAFYQKLAFLNNNEWISLVDPNTFTLAGYDYNLQAIAISGDNLVLTGKFSATNVQNAAYVAAIKNNSLYAIDGLIDDDVNSLIKVKSVLINKNETYNSVDGGVSFANPTINTNQEFTDGPGLSVFGKSFYQGLTGIIISY